jgi:hypothetical protein
VISSHGIDPSFRGCGALLPERLSHLSTINRTAQIIQSKLPLVESPSQAMGFFWLVAHEFVAMFRLVSRILKVEKLGALPLVAFAMNAVVVCISATISACLSRTNWLFKCHFVQALTNDHEAHVNLQVMTNIKLCQIS